MLTTYVLFSVPPSVSMLHLWNHLKNFSCILYGMSALKLLRSQPLTCPLPEERENLTKVDF
jgi:hypothetical protein